MSRNKLEIYKGLRGEQIFRINSITAEEFKVIGRDCALKQKLVSKKYVISINVRVPAFYLQDKGRIVGHDFEIIKSDNSFSLLFKEYFQKTIPCTITGNVGNASYVFTIDWSQELKDINAEIIPKAKGYGLIDGIYYPALKKRSHDISCSVCNRRILNSEYYYVKKPSMVIICQKCYKAAKKEHKDKNNEKKQHKKKEKNLRMQIIKDNAEILQKGTTIYINDVPKKCLEGGHLFSKKYFNVYNGNNDLVLVKLQQCSKCGAFLSLEKKENTLKQYNLIYPDKEILDIKGKKEILAKKQQVKKIIYTDILTRSTTRECTNRKHVLVDVDTEVMVLKNDKSISIERVPAIYCKTCNRYYILETEYQHLDSLGTILCNVVEKNHWLSTNKRQDILITNGESLLHKMGYNVNAYNNVPKSIRWMILRSAFENHLLTKGEIMAHLNTLISRGKARYSFRFAVEKWKTDLEYVRSLSLTHDSEYTFKAKSITHNKYNKKQN